MMSSLNPPRIDSFRFGQVVIDGQPYSKDLIILPDRVLPRWWRQEGHFLHAVDLDEVLASVPAVLVVGQGTFGRMRIDQGAADALAAAGIELVALNTKEACQRYNALREQGDIAAALHLTC